MQNRVLVLDNAVQPYAWGSRTAIAEFLGQAAPSAEPQAELWIGAHPKAPSVILHPPGLGTLEDVIRREPIGLLGEAACDRFGPELPFLFKLLAAAEPLSIQAHPSQEQARAGFRRENESGVPIDAPHRNYRDPHHKPELVCALTPFAALKGFRPLPELVANLRPLAARTFGAELERAAREPGPPTLRALLARLLMLDADERLALLGRTAEAAARRRQDGAWQWVGRLLARYPDDVGVLAPLYLNLIVLEPWEALFLPAGELHAYLEGTALEIMANSDNVLRGGLTPKHVDVPELLATLLFEPQPVEVLRPIEVAPGEQRYQAPAPEFELGLVDLSPGRPFRAAARRSVEILLGLTGNAVLRAADGATALQRGRALAVPAALPGYSLEGEARVARARVPV